MSLMHLSAFLFIAPFLSQGGIFDEGSSGTCPDESPSKGKYVNHSYGFSITIPIGFAGFWNSARCVSQGGECTCMSDHGRIIPLGKRSNGSDRQIEAYADYGSDLVGGTVAEVITAELIAIRSGALAGTMSVLGRNAFKLDGLNARRVAVKYRDKRSKNWMVEDFTEAFRKNVRYLLYLRTPEQRYAHDRIAFDRIVQSFVIVHE